MTGIGTCHPYFEYPSNLWDTQLECGLRMLIAGFFGIREERILCRGSDWHSCDGLVLMPYLDGRIGLDAAVVANQAIVRRLPIFVVVNGRETKVSLSDLRQFETNYRNGVFAIRLVSSDEQRRLAAGSTSLVVSVGETMHRLLRSYYEDAHG